MAQWDRPLSKPESKPKPESKSKPLKRTNSAERDRLERSVTRNLARATSFHRKVAYPHPNPNPNRKVEPEP